MSETRSKYQLEFDALPEWAKKMVLAGQRCAMHGSGDARHHKAGLSPNVRDEYSNGLFTALFAKDVDRQWFEGFCEMLELSGALTAPWPKPEPPTREKRALNVVELMDFDDDGGSGFDRPCCFANRCGGHATYCHNEAWPNHPRKCRRGWDDTWLECPGFVANPDAAKE